MSSSQNRSDLLTWAISSQDGEVNILVNCAGFARNKRLDDVNLTTFEEAIKVNMRSAFLITSAVVPAMPGDRGAG